MPLGNGHSEASRLAVFLGLPGGRRMSDLALVESVERGFPPKTAAILAKRLDPSGRFLQAHHFIPKSTYHRRLINPQHAQAANIRPSLEKPVWWDSRLFE